MFDATEFFYQSRRTRRYRYQGRPFFIGSRRQEQLPSIADRPIFYPGSYADTKPIRQFNGSKYIYCDVNPEILEIFALQSFQELYREDIDHQQIFPEPYRNSYVDIHENVASWVEGIQQSWQQTTKPVCQWRVYERRGRRVEILFIIYDANTIFDWLYFQKNAYPLFGLVSANYYGPSFSRGNPIFELMDYRTQYPKWEIALYAPVECSRYQRSCEWVHLRMKEGRTLNSLMSYGDFKRLLCAQLHQIGAENDTGENEIRVYWYSVSSIREVDIAEIFINLLQYNIEILAYLIRFVQEYRQATRVSFPNALEAALLLKYGDLEACKRSLGEQKFQLIEEIVREDMMKE